MKEKKKFSLLWFIPAVVIVALILWCIYFPLTAFAGIDKDAELESATIMVFEAGGISDLAFNTNDSQRLAEIIEQLRSTRCRFFGWSDRMNISAEKPPLDLIITGYEGDDPFGVHLAVNGKNDVRIWNGNLCLRAKDAALYDYLASFAFPGMN